LPAVITPQGLIQALSSSVLLVYICSHSSETVTVWFKWTYPGVPIFRHAIFRLHLKHLGLQVM